MKSDFGAKWTLLGGPKASFIPKNIILIVDRAYFLMDRQKFKIFKIGRSFLAKGAL